MEFVDDFKTVSACLVRRLPEVYLTIPSFLKLPPEYHLRQYQERELKQATAALREALLHIGRFIEGD